MSHRHLIARMRRSAGSLSLDWQDLSHEGPIGPAEDRISKTGEPWYKHQAITEVGDYLTVANSATHPNRWGYTLISQEDRDDPSGIIFKPGGGFEMREPLGKAGHDKDDTGFASPNEAMIAAEQHYFSLDHAGRPSYHRAPQDSGVDYSDLNSFRGGDDLSDDYGDIFGDRQ